MTNVVIDTSIGNVDKISSTQMSSSDFDRITQRLYRMSGIVIQDHKRTMVQARIIGRIRQLELDSFAEYLDFLETPQGEQELTNFCNALTTNLTSFFREFHHFEHFSKELERYRNSNDHSLRIWSAGCSSGEEPYSIALSIVNKQLTDVFSDIKILATDIDTNVLNKAKMATYEVTAMDEVFKLNAKNSVKVNGSQFEVLPNARNLVSFKSLNLLRKWPMTGKFDVIFCRNVLIYFSAETKAQLIMRFAQMLKPEGVLYLGHSENILGVHPMLINEGKTIYRRGPLSERQA